MKEIMTGPTGNMLVTILVVDDTDFVLDVLVIVLKQANFVVLQANSGPHALKLAASYLGRIDLLLTDVEMPGMSGPYLAHSLKLARPEMRVMFTGGDFLDQNEGCTFIQKPFTAVHLIEKINSILHTDDQTVVARSAPTGGPAEVEPITSPNTLSAS
jgi:two-component system, cell cycle sensor histidine kinase and response regulator CckA